MKHLKLIHFILIFLCLFSGLTSQAKVTAKKTKPGQSGTKLETSLKFDGLNINGKYQVPIETLTVVEDEKLLNDLLSVRMNFKDRLRVQQNHR